MLRYFFFTFVLATVVVIALAGFRGQHSTKSPIEIFPDMDHQPRFDPQHTNGFFADERSARVPVAGTVPMGYTMPNAYYTTSANNNKLATLPGGFTGAPDYYSTGKMGDSYGDGFPVEITKALLERGRERYAINCAICHGSLGLGNGIVSQYGLAGPANFQQEKFRTMPDGQIFNTITNGKNTMGPYGSNVTVEDRWAIISYIRALQRSQNATIGDVPELSRAELDKPAAPPAPAAPAPAGGAANTSSPQPATAAASATAGAPATAAPPAASPPPATGAANAAPGASATAGPSAPPSSPQPEAKK